LVIIEWFLNGKRPKEEVTLSAAKHKRLQLEDFGVTIFWSERI